MALGKRKPGQQEVWIATQDLPKSPGHPFYQKLNEVFSKARFDEYVERLCAPYYAEKLGRPSIPPGVYFRMLLVGYFEGIDSQRGIAWRCADSLSLRAFLGLLPNQDSPDQSSLTVIRKRLPLPVYEQVFAQVLAIAQEYGLLKGRAVAIDASTLEANAAMKSIVRKKTGEDWRKYVRRLAEEAGLEDPTEEDLRRFDKGRKGKKVSNEEWESPTDPDARITKMKDGRTRLGYKAEHVVDVDSDLVVGASVHHGDQADADTLVESVVGAQANLTRAGSDQAIAEAAADKGYHKAEVLAECADWQIRTYIPEARRRGRRRWQDKPEGWQQAVYANRRRCRGKRGKKLQRLRSEKVERSFAQVCNTGGARRTWIRGLLEVTKRYLIQVVAHNLGVIMRKLFGVGTARSLQGSSAAISSLLNVIHVLLRGPRCTLLLVAGSNNARSHLPAGSRLPGSFELCLRPAA